MAFDLFSQTGDFDWIQEGSYEKKVKYLQMIYRDPDWGREFSRKTNNADKVLTIKDEKGRTLLENILDSQDEELIPIIAQNYNPMAIMTDEKTFKNICQSKNPALMIRAIFSHLHPHEWPSLLNKKGRTPLHLLAECGPNQFIATSYLLSHFKLSIEYVETMKDYDGENPLDIAKRTDNSILSMLLDGTFPVEENLSIRKKSLWNL